MAIRKKGVTFGSRRSYYDHVISGKATAQRVIILKCLAKQAAPITRRMIANMTGIYPATVGARVNALMNHEDDWRNLIRISHTGTCPIAKKKGVEFLELNSLSDLNNIEKRAEEKPRSKNPFDKSRYANST